MSEERRIGGKYKWFMEDDHSYSQGVVVDNLDKNNLEEAENTFEKIFITIRKTLEGQKKSVVLDEQGRLQLCHDVARSISKNARLIFP